MKGAIGRACNVLALVLISLSPALAADPSARVELDISKAGPRAVEPQTQQAIRRDYRVAWSSLAQALESNSADPLEGPFVGTAKQWLSDTVASQSRVGMTSHYAGQTHKVQAVFYAPEGDLIELHDVAEFQLQISDGGKVIHEQHVVVNYVVLMTPAADRWVVRELQAVPQF